MHAVKNKNSITEFFRGILKFLLIKPLTLAANKFSSAPKKEKVYEALTTINSLSNWWTKQTTGDTRVGGILQFRFGEPGIDMKVTLLKPNESVSWECVDGFDDWIGTKVNFVLDENDSFSSY